MSEDRFCIWIERLINETPEDDYISRKDAMELLKNDAYAVNELNNLPSVTPKPKTGHWIKYNKEYFTTERLTSVIHSIIECSLCHMKIADFCGEMKYCPSCGRPMVELQESEDNLR